MRAGVTGSVSAHALLLLVAIIGLNFSRPLTPTDEQSISVDLVPVTDMAKVRLGSEKSQLIDTKAPSTVESNKPPTPTEPTGNTSQDQPKPNEAAKSAPNPVSNSAPAPPPPPVPKPAPQPVIPAAPPPPPTPQPAPQPTPAPTPAPPPPAPKPAPQPKPTATATPTPSKELASAASTSADSAPPVPTPAPTSSDVAQQRAELKKQQEAAAQAAAAKAKAAAQAAVEAKAAADAKAKAEAAAEAKADAQAKAVADAAAAAKAAKAAQAKKAAAAAVAALAIASSQSSPDKAAKAADEISQLINNAPSTGGRTGDGGSPSAGKATGADASLTQSEIGMLSAAIKKCWSLLPSQIASGVQPELDFKLNRDGSLDGAPKIVSTENSEMGQQIAQSAKRAVQQCQPYKLPAAKYDAWSEVDLVMDPSPN